MIKVFRVSLVIREQPVIKVIRVLLGQVRPVLAGPRVRRALRALPGKVRRGRPVRRGPLGLRAKPAPQAQRVAPVPPALRVQRVFLVPLSIRVLRVLPVPRAIPVRRV